MTIASTSSTSTSPSGAGRIAASEVDRRGSAPRAARRSPARAKGWPQIEAEHAVHAAVQVDDVAAAGAAVQAVDVLGDDAR